MVLVFLVESDYLGEKLFGGFQVLDGALGLLHLSNRQTEGISSATVQNVGQIVRDAQIIRVSVRQILQKSSARYVIFFPEQGFWKVKRNLEVIGLQFESRRVQIYG